METIKNFDQMVSHLQSLPQRRRVAVAFPHDSSTQGAVARALGEGFIDAVLIGDRQQMGTAFEPYHDHVTYVEATDALDACRQAVSLARDGKADVPMKGLVNTDDLLRAVLSKTDGLLPPGRVLTHVTCAHIEEHGDQLLFCTDVAVIPYPTADQRRQQLKYLLDVCRTMGISEPRVGLINCTEKVNEKHFPFTVEYKELIAEAQRGDFGPCIVDGPLDLKTCFSPEALHKKGIASPLEGRADAIIFPDIQAGNVFYKTITCFCHTQTAAMLCGPSVPVVLPSRGDSPDNKFYSLALASL